MQALSTTVIIIIINCIVSYLALNNPQLMNRFLLTPYWIERKKEYYRFVTSGFIHANYPHLIFNMISLYFFGYIAEAWLGTGLYIVFYLSAIVVSDIPTYLKNKHNSNYASLGASGAVSAVIFASIILKPFSTLLIYFIPMPAIVFGILYLAYSYYMDKKSRDNVNHSAHLYGAIYGLVFMSIYDYRAVLAMIQTVASAVQNIIG
ncbi:rhomboid family intramembrane serine protease [Cytophaga aurantiaca]|uniref:rhomboid family intramembrane serine protease n=1 Tax=Cytophaga aurantiaca TaxID=29530 RepID=UPI00037C65FA|nr:rhomboid family intramembrane serine protease [Cytophaga aurantiaca]